MKFLILIFCFLSFSLYAQEDEVDAIPLAQNLLKNGHFKRAINVLEKHKPNKDELDDLKEYHTLLGLAYFQNKEFAKSEKEFLKSFNFGQKDNVFYFFYAQSLFKQEKWQATLGFLKSKEKSLENETTFYFLLIEACDKNNDVKCSWSYLNKGLKRFPDDYQLQKRKLHFFAKKELLYALFEFSSKFLNRDDVKVDDFLMVSEAFRSKKDFYRAIYILESAKRRFPDDDKILSQLALSYMQRGDKLIPAYIYQQLKNPDDDIILQIGELFRNAEKYHQSVFFNTQVKDAKKKYKQRLGLLIDLEDYEQVESMKDRLERIGLLKDQEMLYAMAFAEFKNKNYFASLKTLSQITDKALFIKANQLRKIISKCSKDQDGC